jgi:DNA-binding NarL/FixJ family response regulator
VLGYVLKGDAGDELPQAVLTVAAGQQYVSTNARGALEGPGRTK